MSASTCSAASPSALLTISPLRSSTLLHLRWDSGSVVEQVGICSEGRLFDLPLPNVPWLSLGKTLNPPCLVWMCMTAVCWGGGRRGSHASVSLPHSSCGYYHSLPPPVWLCEWMEPVRALWVSRKAPYKSNQLLFYITNWVQLCQSLHLSLSCSCTSTTLTSTVISYILYITCLCYMLGIMYKILYVTY